jgi:integrase
MVLNRGIRASFGWPIGGVRFGLRALHELRHSCASLLLAMGVPLEVVSETLGHSSIRVTKAVYGHLLAPARASAAEAMARALWTKESEKPRGGVDYRLGYTGRRR